jgi:hypothetical protein
MAEQWKYCQEYPNESLSGLIYTTLIGEQDLALLETIRLALGIFQEYNLRAYDDCPYDENGQGVCLDRKKTRQFSMTSLCAERYLLLLWALLPEVRDGIHKSFFHGCHLSINTCFELTQIVLGSHG